MPHVLGLASGGWAGSRSIDFDGDIKTARGTYDGFKTYTYVTLAAAARTTIQVLAPSDALLFYTTGDNWDNRLTDAEVIEGATKSVTLHRCGSNLAGYAGELLLAGAELRHTRLPRVSGRYPTTSAPELRHGQGLLNLFGGQSHGGCADRLASGV